VAFFDLSTNPAPSAIDTTIVNPIEGRVEESGVQFVIDGQATAPGQVRRVQVEIQDRNSKQYLQDDMASWGPRTTSSRASRPRTRPRPPGPCPSR
jgi:hypothetical protein